MIQLLFLTLLCCSLLMMLAWKVQQASGNSTWVDVAWSFGTGAAGIALILAPPHAASLGPRAALVAAVAALWSLRLGLHMLRRALAGRDDPRYAALKDRWGAAYRWKMPAFLQVQALSVFLLGGVIMLAGRNPAPGLGVLDALGLAAGLLSIVGEAMADRTVARFARNPAHRGKICEDGLWAWSRHPNYFCEWLIWVAFALFASTGGGWFLAAWAGPVLMYLVLVHGSGIPPTEAHMLESRGDAFRDYQRRVPKFFPRPPRGAAR